jgi:hypothetical protein
METHLKKYLFFVFILILLFTSTTAFAQDNDQNAGASTEANSDDSEESGSSDEQDVDEGYGESEGSEQLPSEAPQESAWWHAPDWAEYTFGDQMFTIAIGLNIPTAFTYQSGGKAPKNENLGGTGLLAYSFFFNRMFYGSAEIGGTFNSSIGRNMQYNVPLGLSFGAQFHLWRFEFPVSVGFGMVWSMYVNSRLYYGFYFRPRIGAFFRMNADWSFGVTSSYWLLPQIGFSKSDQGGRQNILGHFFDVSVTARYHF